MSRHPVQSGDPVQYGHPVQSGHPRPSRRPRRTVTAIALALGLVLTGCTDGGGNGEGTGTPGPTGTTETPTEAALTDRSDLVTGFEFPAEPVGEAEGKPLGSTQTATLTVYAVETSETSTRLIYGIRATDGTLIGNHLAVGAWNAMPTLDDTAGDKRYWVNTFKLPDSLRDGGSGVYQSPTGRAIDFSPMTVQYPPLDPGIDEIDVVMPGFEPIAAPVVRR